MMAINQQTFRDAMACVGAAVNIITTDGEAGQAGFTASAVCSVTDSPPTLLVCLNRAASVWPVFNQNRALCVNTLAAGQEGCRTYLAVRRRWRSALPPRNGKPVKRAAHGWRGRWPHLTAISIRW
jgi:flavin reductase (DIM6/NTAB) family NADH-FMN oxidoreductase RutF